jgi:diketogulonate reductase-like aldo/keto reductase
MARAQGRDQRPEFIYGTAWKEERTAALTELALRAGFRAIDTANQRKHYHEAEVGQALAAAYRAGVCQREDLFLQTKFTYQRGQDHRLPYDPAAPLTTQVGQSLESSIEHLGTDYIDSFVLHGPASNHAWTEADAEVWHSMVKQRDAGHVRLLGVSNISRAQLEQMAASHADLPTFVQNRCYAQLGWDREVREWCRENASIYQGFSLLTANVPVLRHPRLQEIAAVAHATPIQVVFAFARSIGILPLTGTTSEEHMREDLASLKLQLSQAAISEIERLHI